MSSAALGHNNFGYIRTNFDEAFQKFSSDFQQANQNSFSEFSRYNGSYSPMQSDQISNFISDKNQNTAASSSVSFVWGIGDVAAHSKSRLPRQEKAVEQFLGRLSEKSPTFRNIM